MRRGYRLWRDGHLLARREENLALLRHEGGRNLILSRSMGTRRGHGALACGRRCLRLRTFAAHGRCNRILDRISRRGDLWQDRDAPFDYGDHGGASLTIYIELRADGAHVSIVGGNDEGPGCVLGHAKERLAFQ